MQLEDGKAYVNGQGSRVVVSLSYPGTDFPFVGDNYDRFMNDGRFVPKDMDWTPVAVLGLKEEVN